MSPNLLTLTNRNGTILFFATENNQGSYDYICTGGGGGCNLTKEMILDSARTVSEFKGAKSAKAHGEWADAYNSRAKK